jgi:hypothetical protein
VVGQFSKKAPAGPLELRWAWSITSIVPASLATHGTVATLEEKVLKRNKRRKWRRMRAYRAAI